jgi:hypothetical protein
MAAYAVIANGPCIAAQRHNRGRLGALLEARQRRAGQSSSCRTRQAT